MRVYFDSCIAIYIVERIQPWYARIDAALNDADDVQIIVSDLVRLECRVLPVRNNNEHLLREFDRFFDRNQPERLGWRVFDRATHLRAVNRLPTPDALHIGAAIESGCEEFWTNDNRLDRVTLPIRVRAFAD